MTSSPGCRPLLGSTVIAALTACGEPPRRTDVPIRDSAGVEIVDNPTRAPTTWSLAPEPRLDIGMTEGEDARQLDRVVGAVLTRGGDLVIADGGSNELRFFDATGAHVRSIGGEGEGPGAFTRLASLYRRIDSLVAFDARFRFTVFDERGSLGRTTPPGALFVGLLADGTLVSYEIGSAPEPTPGSFRRSRAVLIRHSAHGEVRDTIVGYPLNEAWIDEEVPGFSGTVFGRGTSTLMRGDRIWVADNATYEIRELAPSGALVRSIRRSVTQRPVSSADVDRFIRFMTAEYAGAPSEIRDMRLAPYLNQPPPSSMPAFGRSGLFRGPAQWLLLDDVGRLWIQDYLAFPDETPRWSIFDRGRLTATVAVPPGFEITHAGAEAVVGVWRDDLDVEHVRVYDLIR